MAFMKSLVAIADDEIADEAFPMATTLAGVNAPFAMRRTRVWAGGSTLASVGTARKPPSSKALRAAGQAGRSGAFALAAEKTCGLRKTWRISG
jgi:hypothetical protein